MKALPGDHFLNNEFNHANNVYPLDCLFEFSII